MKYFGICIVLFSFFCCNPSVSENNALSETNYGKIDDSDLKFKFGDIILFVLLYFCTLSNDWLYVLYDMIIFI